MDGQVEVAKQSWSSHDGSDGLSNKEAQSGTCTENGQVHGKIDVSDSLASENKLTSSSSGRRLRSEGITRMSFEDDDFAEMEVSCECKGEAASQDSVCGGLLYIAAIHGHLDTLRKLVSCGHSDFNITYMQGLTALHICVMGNHKECVQILMDMGASPNRRDRKGNLPLHYAVQEKNSSVIHNLISSGSPQDTLNTNYESPLSIAVRNGHFPTISQLVALGCNANVSKPDGTNLLHTLVCKYSSDYQSDFQQVLELLIMAGCNINAEAYNTLETPLYRALSLQKFVIAEILLSYGADPNLSSPFDITALQLACRSQDFGSVNLMMHSGIQWKRERWIEQVSYFQSQEAQSVLSLVLKWKRSVVSLQNLSRTALRQHYGDGLFKTMSELRDIPLSVKRFIMLADVKNSVTNMVRPFSLAMYSNTWDLPDKSETKGPAENRKSNTEDLDIV